MTSETRTPAQQCRCGHFDYNHWLSGKGSCAVPECDCNGFYAAQAIDAAIEPPEAPPDLAASVAALAETVAELDKESTRRHYEWLDATRELSDRLAALESPAAAPDPSANRCPDCGGDGLAKYTDPNLVKWHHCQTCYGTGLVPAEPPAAVPDAAPTDDIVLIGLVIDYGDARACFAGSHAQSNVPMMKYWCDEADKRLNAIRAYGRDGAR